MVFPWKMLVGPALLLGMKVLKIDYDRPDNLLLIRIFYGISQIALFSALGYIALSISKHGDEKKSLKVKTPSPAGTEPAEDTEMTFKDYDMSELKKLLKSFSVGAVMTVAIHAYMAVVPALLLQMVTQPITLYDHALFAIYVLKKDASQNPKLKRPFADDSPTAKLEALRQQANQEKAKHEALAKEKEPESPESSTSSGASGNDSQPTLSRAERRPRPLRGC